ncbi:DUF192 domain-containing protein [Oryzicola mucosus]|uniref:DUF192 domain-containing protein n=1 Tax=Oryzicola mucosus TaxID=2767425 RepID=A0A8J6PJW7_9HYPH|nr:DUF192 domain-containing protein [Oryzicola mucosus]MBD0414981.1 DUF192 domain-containing protein [Oryzicola mucosus]
MNFKNGLVAGALSAFAVLGGLAAPMAQVWAQQPALSDNSPMDLPADPAPLVIQTQNGDKSFTIEIADEAGERAMGLMYRTDLSDDEGMLFVFGQTQPLSFWMKNTPLPLDLIFIGRDGRIRDIKQGQPFSEAPISPSEPARFVLELKAGTADKNGIKRGDLLRHPAIQQAPNPD